MITQSYLEHNNITVNNLDEAVKFIQTAMPEFKIRGCGEDNQRRWLHIGTDESYLALSESFDKKRGSDDYLSFGFNHMGFVVPDVKAVGKRLEEAGYERSYPLTEQKFRIRDYFLDDDANEYEFIQYLSEKPEEKNTYDD
ncbi:MAG: VOC family protein [Flavobacteriales bacterium]|nr:VOC family protein [Flavobacteriales bacterium]